MSTFRVFVVVDAAGNVRAARKPRIGPNEVGFAINIKVPDGWGKVVGPEISVTLPDVPRAEVTT